MIKVIIELWPHGFESRAKVLGTAFISNDGTGTDKRGNYDVNLFGKTTRSFRHIRIRDFPRKSYTAWKLLYLALDKIYGGKK